MKVGGPNLTIALMRHQLFGPLEPHPIALPHHSTDLVGCPPVNRCPDPCEVPRPIDCRSHDSRSTTWIPDPPMVTSLTMGPDNGADQAGADGFPSVGTGAAENSLGNLLDLFA